MVLFWTVDAMDGDTVSSPKAFLVPSPKHRSEFTYRNMHPIGSKLQEEAELFALHCASTVPNRTGTFSHRSRFGYMNRDERSRSPTSNDVDSEIALLHQKLARLGVDVKLDEIRRQMKYANSRLAGSPNTVHNEDTECISLFSKEGENLFPKTFVTVPPLRLASALSQARTPRARSESHHSEPTATRPEEQVRPSLFKSPSRRPATTRGRLENSRSGSCAAVDRKQKECITSEERIPCTLVIRTSKWSDDSSHMRPATARARLEQNTTNDIYHADERSEVVEIPDNEKMSEPEISSRRASAIKSDCESSESSVKSFCATLCGYHEKEKSGVYLSPRTNRKEPLGIFAGPDTPGPGAYNLRETSDIESRKANINPHLRVRAVSVGKDRRFRLEGPELEALSHPGPNSYNVDRSCFSYSPRDRLFSPRGIFFIDSARKPSIAEKNGARTPGPGQYEILRTMDSWVTNSSHSKRSKFGTEEKIPLSCVDKERKKVPGPGSYNGISTRNVRSCSIAGGQSRFLTLYPKSIVPGPGTYTIDGSLSEISPGLPLPSNTIREALDLYQSMKWSPSPGAYEHMLIGRDIGTRARTAHWFGAPGGRDRPAVGDPIVHQSKVPSCWAYSPRFAGTAKMPGKGPVFPKASRYCRPILFR